jgi:hypothetical protein
MVRAEVVESFLSLLSMTCSSLQMRLNGTCPSLLKTGGDNALKQQLRRLKVQPESLVLTGANRNILVGLSRLSRPER